MSADWVSDGRCPFVQKPFLPSTLIEPIRDALAQPPQSLRPRCNGLDQEGAVADAIPQYRKTPSEFAAAVLFAVRI